MRNAESGMRNSVWETRRLGEMVSIARGGSPRPIESYLTNSSDGINWIKIGDVGADAKYVTNTEEKIIPKGAEMSRRVSAGDFLLSNSMSFGRPYILQIDGCIHDGWLTIQKYSDHLEREFLYYILSSKYVTDQYDALASGSSVKNLNKEIVENISIPLPPLAEQRRIAEVLGDTDALIANLEKRIAKRKLVKQGMMQELMRTREGWIEKPLGDVCDINPHSDRALPTEFFYIDLESVKDGKLLSHNRINRAEAPSRAQRFIMQGDILFQTVRPYQKNNLYVGFKANEYIASTGYAVLREKNGVSDSGYVYQFIHTDAFVFDVLDRCDGTSYPAINPQKLRMVNVRLPSDVFEQRAIAAVLTDMDSEIAVLEKKAEKYRQLKRGMMSELLTGKVRLEVG